MEGEIERRNMKSIAWGVFLILLGGAYLLDRLHVVGLPSLGELWPLVFFVIAAVRLAERRWGGALTMVALGAWFLACTTGWQGFSYERTWPLLLVGVGAGIVVRALSGEDARRRPAKEE